MRPRNHQQRREDVNGGVPSAWADAFAVDYSARR